MANAFTPSPHAQVITSGDGLNQAIVDNTGALKTTATFSGSISIGNITITDADDHGPVTVMVYPDSAALTTALVNSNGDQIGIASAPIRVDPTGTTVQPVNGTVTVQQATAANLNATIVFASPQHVIVDSGGGGGTQYAQGTTQATPTGTVALGQDPSNVLYSLQLDASHNLKAVVENTVTVTGTVAATQSGSWTVAATQSGSWSVSVTGTVAVTQSGSWTVAATQSGSWSVTATQATAANLNATVVFPSAQPVTLTSTTITGTVAVTQSTSPWVTQDESDQTIGTAVGTEALMIGVKDNTGKVAFLNLDGSGNLKVSSSGGGGGTQYTDGTAESSGAFTGTVAMAFDGTDVWGLRMDGSKNLNVNLNASSATVTVTGTVAATQSGSWTVAATQSGSWSVTATQATAANLNATVVFPSAQPVTLASTTITGTVAVTQSGTWTVQQGGAPWTVEGNVASGATDAGNPEKIGGVFNTTQPTVTNGQRVDAQSTARGALIVGTGVDTFHVTVDNTVAVTLASTTITGTVAVTQSGSWTVAGTGNFTVVQPTAANLNATIVFASAQPVTQSGTWTNTVTQATAANLNATVTPAANTLFPSPQVVGVIYDSSGNSHNVLQISFSGITATTTLVALVAAQQVRVLSFKYSTNGAVNVQLQSHTTTTNCTGLDYFVANQGATYAWNPGFHMASTSGEALDIYLSAAVAVSGYVTYVQY